MTAHTPITADPLDKLARDILAGDLSGLPQVDHQRHDYGEWVQAAQGVVDGGDTSDLSGMIREELAFDAWCELPERLRDEWCGFGNFFAKWPASAGFDGGDFDAGASHPDSRRAL